MPSELASGSQLAVIGTEHTLDTRTSAGTYQLQVDLSNLLDGDAVELRVKSKARSAEGTAKLAYLATFSHAQGSPIVFSIPVMSTYVVFTLKQTGGTGRTFVWSVLG